MSKDFVRSISDFKGKKSSEILHRIHIDHVLLPLVAVVLFFGLAILHSASSGEIEVIYSQSVRIALGFILMLAIAQVPGHYFFRWAPIMYLGSVVLLFCVYFFGVEAKGGKRWLEILGIFRFQPSEIRTR